MVIFKYMFTSPWLYYIPQSYHPWMEHPLTKRSLQRRLRPWISRPEGVFDELGAWKMTHWNNFGIQPFEVCLADLVCNLQLTKYEKLMPLKFAWCVCRQDHRCLTTSPKTTLQKPSEAGPGACAGCVRCHCWAIKDMLLKWLVVGMFFGKDFEENLRSQQLADVGLEINLFFWKIEGLRMTHPTPSAGSRLRKCWKLVLGDAIFVCIGMSLTVPRKRSRTNIDLGLIWEWSGARRSHLCRNMIQTNTFQRTSALTRH